MGHNTNINQRQIRKGFKMMRFFRGAHQLARLRGTRLVIGLAVLPVALFGAASSALAQPHHPTGEFAQFGDCPLSNAQTENCIYSLSNGGYFTVGKKTVPLKNPVTLQGGFKENVAEELEFIGAEDGNTLSKTPQPVPGGLLGITAPTSWPKFLQEWFNNGINNGLTGVNATVELAAPASSIGLSTENLLFEEGTALSLPVKIHLENALLGSTCYIGSNSHPVVIPFTTGQSGKIHGSAGELSFNKAFTLITIKGGKLVNNTFAAPGATGCGGPIIEYLLDPLVNSVLGVPAGAGSNTAVLEGTLQTATANAVRASE